MARPSTLVISEPIRISFEITLLVTAHFALLIVNPAEFMLDAIGAGVSPRIGDRDWNDIWLDSQEYQNVRAEIDTIKATALAIPETDTKTLSTCEFAVF